MSKQENLSSTNLNLYFYRIKVPKLTDTGYTKEWDFKPIDIGYINASSKLEARKKIEHEYNANMCQRSKREDIGTKNIYLIQIYDYDEYYYKFHTQTHVCIQCNNTFTKLERDKLHDFKNIKVQFCSDICENEYSLTNFSIHGADYDFSGKHNAVIYRIWNKKTEQSYIGKTTQAFTLRWYQHFYQPSNAKFHNAISDSNLKDWVFEIVETFNFTGDDIDYQDSKGYKKLMSEREQYWIDYFKANDLGYNSVKAFNISENKSLKINEDELWSLFD